MRQPPELPLSRRRLLQHSMLGGLGLSLASLLQLKEQSACAAETGKGEIGKGESGRLDPGATTRSFGKAKACIVLFAWGGMSHIDTWDPKPLASEDIRGEFVPIATKTPGIWLTQHMGALAARTDKLAIVRSVNHLASDHRAAAYWNMTGHAPRIISAPAIPPSIEDWPCIGSLVQRGKQGSAVHTGTAGNSAPITIPYPIADRGLNYGQYSGFLGQKYEPLFLNPGRGTPYVGVSPTQGTLTMGAAEGVDRPRLEQRRQLLDQLETLRAASMVPRDVGDFSQLRRRANELLGDGPIRRAVDLDRESAAVHEAYGNHICGQSVLMARRLTEIGVPLVTVNCGAGDLNSGQGQHWDTHGDNFNQLKKALLPPLMQASGALLDDLARSGKLDETLVVWFTEFGRTPRMTGNGRDHFPGCYSVAFAGGGVRGGQVLGSSDKTGFAPASMPCGPEDLHATVFHALGIDQRLTINDLQGRPHPLSAGKVLPVF